MKVELSTPVKFGLGLLIVALVGFLFESKSVGGFALGLGGLILVYSGFKVFWKKLEDRFEE